MGGGTANFVVGMKDCLDVMGAMNSTNSNVGGWNGCERRTWCNEKAYNAIPESLRPAFKKMKTVTNAGFNNNTPTESEDYLALFAIKEVMGSDMGKGSTEAESSLFQFDWYKTSANQNKTAPGNSGYLTRSCPIYVLNSWIYIRNRAALNAAGNAPEGLSFFGCI